MSLSDKQSLSSRVIKTENVNWREFRYVQQDDFKEMPHEAWQKLKASILGNNFTQPFYIWEDEAGVLWCLDGRHRTKALEELSKEQHDIPYLLPATFIRCENKKEASKLVLIYSSMYAKMTEQGLFDFMKTYELDLDEMKTEIDIPDLDMLKIESLFNPELNDREAVRNSLQEEFIVPPFSILDTRQGYWMARKDLWKKLIPNSQETREEVELYADSAQNTEVYELRNKMRAANNGVDPTWEEILIEARKRSITVYSGASIFDSVLTEICYRWFNVSEGKILDPFAGGSVRGLVAGMLGFFYTGIDLRKEQVEANFKQSETIPAAYINRPKWIEGDSKNLQELLPIEYEADLIFSCPPYHDLEQYCDDPNDLSNMDYESFLQAYRHIIEESCKRLKEDRFAVFVVSEIRNKEGFYKNFVKETIEAFEAQGLHFYNDIILINQIGSAAIRSRRMFEVARKLCRVHQNVLVFYKGDPKQIRIEFPKIKTGNDLDETEYQPNIATLAE